MKERQLGPRHRSALQALCCFAYTGIGNSPTFRGGDIAIPCRLMAGLVDRGWASVADAGRHHMTGEPMWKAEITEAGREALSK
jgi:hypothetical protein